ncbi:MAG: LysM domain-containing protein [Coriobacteriales bacterium]|nr:LysM domain-containing protein [Coriobacteriales bacterium]
MDPKYQTFGSLALCDNGTRRLVVIEGGASKSHRTSGADAKNPRKRPAHAHANRILALFVASVIVAFFLAQSVMDATHASRVAQLLSDMPTQEVFVCTGDTMWHIAERHSVDGVSTAELVGWMKDVNNMDTACLYPGQVLLVPQTS